MAKKLTNEDYLQKCKDIHGDKFDYSKTNYVNIRTKIIVICKVHGEFIISPDNHVGKQKQGCVKCAQNKHKLTMISDERLKKFKEIHNDRYEYIDLSVINGEISIICPSHGEFKQIIYNHLNGNGCMLCFGNPAIPKISDERLNKLKLLHSNKYEYKDSSITNGYINIICPIHGEFKQSINLHENGSECSPCAYEKRSMKIKGFKELSPIINGEKACVECGEIKSIDMFVIPNSKSYRIKCDECYSTHHKTTTKKYRQGHKRERLDYDKIYRKNRMENDSLYKSKIIARTVIRKSITKSGYTKKSRTFEILGCTYEHFHNHLKNLFLDGMNWGNRYAWDIDHIIPLSFGKTEEECIMLNNYKNLRPIWKVDNREKSSNITEKTDIYYDILNKRNNI